MCVVFHRNKFENYIFTSWNDCITSYHLFSLKNSTKSSLYYFSTIIERIHWTCFEIHPLSESLSAIQSFWIYRRRVSRKYLWISVFGGWCVGDIFCNMLKFSCLSLRYIWLSILVDCRKFRSPVWRMSKHKLVRGGSTSFHFSTCNCSIG